jgi:hypothetical protein
MGSVGAIGSLVASSSWLRSPFGSLANTPGFPAHLGSNRACSSAVGTRLYIGAPSDSA